jgi:hypothetical protein
MGTMKNILCLAFALIPAPISAQSLPSGWTTRERANATIHTNAAGTATVMIGEWRGETDLSGKLNTSVQFLDKQPLCAGIGTVATTPILNGAALKKRYASPQAMCSLSVAQDAQGLLVIITIEQIGINANAEGIGQALLSQRLAHSGVTPTIAARTPPVPAPAPLRQGNAVSSILGVHYGSQMIMMGFGEASGLQRFESMTILFKDGTACYNCLDEWIKDPSISKYRRDKPDDMGRWRKVGATYQISYPGSTDTHDADANRLIGAAPMGTKLNATYVASGVNMTGYSDSATSVAYTDVLSLRSDGRFLWGGDYSMFGRSPGSAFSGRGASPNRMGRYTIAGYWIRFEFDDGSVETKSLGIDPMGQRFIVVDSSIYILPDRK